jgi:hypothetical protein
MDLFVSHYWVKVTREGSAVVVNMLPEHAATVAQPTVADLNRDGRSDVMFGLADGRVFVYETGMAHREGRMVWATANGNRRRTGTR